MCLHVQDVHDACLHYYKNTNVHGGIIFFAWATIVRYSSIGSEQSTLEFRLDRTKINGENNTQQRHIVIKQEEKGVI